MTPRFSQITLLHDRNDLPNGAVARLEAVLAPAYPMIDYHRPLIPNIGAETAFDVVSGFASQIKKGSLVIGMGRGGLLACALQQMFPALNLAVFAVNPPTREETIFAGPRADINISDRLRYWTERVVLYSSAYPPIKGRCDWERIAGQNYDVPWLSEGCNSFYPVSYLVSAFMRGLDMQKEVGLMFPATAIMQK